MKKDHVNNNLKEQYVIYDRKSTDDANNQKNSLIYQRQRNLEYVQREN